MYKRLAEVRTHKQKFGPAAESAGLPGVTIPGGSGGRKATAGHVLLGVISALYDRGDWAELDFAPVKATRCPPAAL